MSIGISLNVDARKVTEAKRELGFLNERLKETEGRGKDLGLGKNLEATSDLIRKLSEDMRRLRGIAGAGDRAGGVIKADQFALAEKYSKRFRENFAAATGEITKARDELKRLRDEHERLAKADSSTRYESPVAHMRRKQQMEALQSQISARESRLAPLEKLDAKARQYGRQATEAGDTIGGFTTAGAGRLPLKKALAAGAALMGGMSLLGFLNDSMSKEFAFGSTEADLLRRGGSGARGNLATFGFTSMEHLGILGSLNRSGLTGSGLTGSAEMVKAFARGRGIDGESAAGYAGGLAVFSSAKIDKHFEKLRDAVIKSGATPKIEEFLRINQDMIRRTALASGGIVGGRGSDFLTGLQAALWSTGKAGQGEMGAGLLSKLDQGIRSGGGSPGKDLFWLTALGGDKAQSYDDYYEYQRRRSQGLSNPENLRGMYGLAKKQFGLGSDGKLSKFGRGNLMSLLGITPDQADLLADMGSRGMFSEDAVKKFLNADGSVGGDARSAMGSSGNRYRQTASEIEALKLTIGDNLLPAINQVKGALTEGANLFIEQLQKNPLTTLTATTLVLGGGGVLSGVGGSIAGGAAGAAALKGIKKGTGYVLKQGAARSAGGALASAGAGSLGLVPGIGALTIGAGALTAVADKETERYLRSLSNENLEQLMHRNEVVGVGGDNSRYHREYERRFGGDGAAEDLAERIARGVAEALQAQRNEVQRVEVINPTSPSFTERTTFGSGG